MKGMAIGGLGIVHVFLAQFGIGGGLLLCYFQWLAQTGREPLARQFIDGYFKFVVLVSFVLGAITGVGMWFMTIQVSARTIGAMVGEFHWVWAVEWLFFCLEIVAGYCFYRYGPRLDDRRRMTLLAIYSVASWFSLFWINGILSWQLTPGRFLETGVMWDGFFNPSFFPSVIFRTITSMAIAALASFLVVNILPEFDRAQRTVLIHRATHFLAPALIMPVLGIWYFMVIPADSREWAMGGNVPMMMFFVLAIVCSTLISAYSLVGLLRYQLYINAATATLLLVLAVLATAFAEFVREGVRKPYSIRGYMFSNSLMPDDIRRFREVGCTHDDPYPLRDADSYPNPQVALGAHVYRNLCSVCHTPAASNGLTHLTEYWDETQLRLNIAMLQRTKPFMPPFAGTAAELEALVQWLRWNNDGKPATWTESHDEATLQQIQAWLDEAGTEPWVAVAAEGRR
ncbi:MAG: c-type cytochrome [Planctomycetaceae bacterium]|nr:c-type cytochrome [Planctomycetaceae bacterium]